LIAISIAGLLALTFLVDAVTPLGYSEWTLYVLAVTAALLQSDTRVPLLAAAAGTLLMMAGFFASPAGTDPALSVVNRSLGAAVLWAMAVAVHLVIRTRNQAAELLWLQRARSGLAQALLGDQSMEEIGRNASAALAGFLDANVGVLYRLEGPELVRCGGHAIDAEPLPLRIALGDGLVGQAAVDGVIRVVDDVPGDRLSIRTALGSSRPCRLVVAPIRAGGRICGVVELAALSCTLRRDRVTALMEATADTIGAALRSAHYRGRLVSLLEETQHQAEELQRQQEELRTSNEELEEQSRVLEESHARLEAQQVELETANRYKREFVARMSHELRTPLNSALILSKLLAENREGTLSDTQVNYAKAIHASNQDLLALIDDVLDLAKIESGHLGMEVTTVEVPVLLERLRAVFEPLAAPKGLELDIRADADVPATIASDSLRLAQVLKNLMANAVKFTEQGRVHLRVRILPGERLAFEVHDTGIGIARDQLEVIFEAFMQAEGGAGRRYGGTGLGLSISRELAQRLGGEIVVYSELGRGSVFTLIMPLRVPDSATPGSETRPASLRAVATAPRAALAPPAAAGLRRVEASVRVDPQRPVHASQRDAVLDGRRILLAEDDVRTIFALSSVFEPLGVHVEIARNGREAVEKLEIVPGVDLVLMDVAMQDMDGLTAIRRIRERPCWTGLPVIALTAAATGDDRDRCLEAGASDYVAKPVDVDKLVSLCRVWMPT
jgi:signal transduction histidine kinase